MMPSVWETRLEQKLVHSCTSTFRICCCLHNANTPSANTSSLFALQAIRELFQRVRNCHAIIGLFQKDGLWKEKWNECHGNLFSMCVCVSVLWEFHVGVCFFLIDICQTFYSYFKISLGPLLPFPPSFLSEPAAICHFSEGLCCNYTSAKLWHTHSLPHTSANLPAGLLCSTQILQYEPNLFAGHGRLHPWSLAVEISPSESCIRTLLNTCSQGCAFVCMKNLNSLEYFHFQCDDLIEKQHQHSDFKDILC